LRSGRGGGGGGPADIKSNNPHLTGGEQNVSEKEMFIADLQTWLAGKPTI